ncbi:MAG: restriction endonuclease [Candidatus Aenigmarchaeota archaeon]|nr:restriction endonuclease [Candidatus Aenigmarchaeota archaeon]
MQISILDDDVLKHYKSPSQIIRVLSENWFSSEMYCPCCLNGNVESLKNNTKVLDFICPKCRNDFQLKASKTKFGKRVVDGEFYTMTSSIGANRIPNFLLMHYSRDEWVIKNLFMVPRFFFSLSIIEKRNPTKPKGRSNEWVGCNILLDRIPEDGRIPIIRNEEIISKEKVNKAWKRMSFLNEKRPELRGWTSDVLKCVEDLRKEQFILKDVYKFEDYLKELHPANNNIKAKIRQQLQILRDKNLLEFNSRGEYKIIRM